MIFYQAFVADNDTVYSENLHETKKTPTINFDITPRQLPVLTAWGQKLWQEYNMILSISYLLLKLEFTTNSVSNSVDCVYNKTTSISLKEVMNTHNL